MPAVLCGSPLAPCVGSRRRAPLPENGEMDAGEKAARNAALGLHPDAHLPSKQGVLNKRSETLFKGWADRLVVLDDISMRYYDVSMKDADHLPSSSARGLVPLNSKSKVLKLDGDSAPRVRGAGLDWKGSVTEAKGMPFCFKIETAGKEYFFQAYSEGERSGWIQVVHARIEILARMDPRAQQQQKITNLKMPAWSLLDGFKPLSGRSSPAEVPFPPPSLVWHSTPYQE